MIQLNLLPDIKIEYLKNARMKRTIVLVAVAVSGFFLAVVAILISTVFIVQKQHISNLSEDIDKDIQTLKEVKDLDKVLTIQNQLVELPQLHSEKPQVQRVPKFLASITPGNVKIGEVDFVFVDDKNTLTITGATVDYKEVNRFVDILKNAEYRAEDENSGTKEDGQAFSEVVLEAVSRDDRADPGVAAKFSVSLVFDEKLFTTEFQKVNIVIPAIESSVSSQERPNSNSNSNNQDVFDEGAVQGGGQ